MAFVNEYGTDEDIEKYGLNEAWVHFNPTREVPFHGRMPELTIDRESNVFLMVRGIGPVSTGTQYNFILSIRGQLVKATLNTAEGSSGNMDDRPFLRIWDLVHIKKSSSCTLSYDEIIENLKRAVTAYGYRGVRYQVPDTVVEYNF